MVTAPYKYCRVGIIFNLAGHGMCLMALEVLELYDGKLSRTVLRGERGCKAPDLPGAKILGFLLIINKRLGERKKMNYCKISVLIF